MTTYMMNGKNSIATPGEEAYLHIGEVAEKTGLTQRTIRYYEELGLLPRPSRSQGDFRLYSPADVKRLEQIVRLKDLFGFSLAEVRDIVTAEETRIQSRDEYLATEDAAVRMSKLDQAEEAVQSQLQVLARKLGQMLEMRGELEAKLARYNVLRGKLLGEIEAGASAGLREEQG